MTATDATEPARGPAILGLGGNVREWVLDVVEAEPKGYPGCAATPCSDPWRASPSAPLTADPLPPNLLGAASAAHVTRGCSVLDDAPRCHAAARGLLEGHEGDLRIGFRCVRKAK
ncbi:MAG: hypothetical protein IPG04_24785 [Polyangiaceae bacterium]|nr:hypothetical protein [Polyangiaceae bacterium]